LSLCPEPEHIAGTCLRQASYHNLKKSTTHARLCRPALTGEEPDPLMPEEMEKAIREMPRDAEVIDLLKRLSAEGPLPAR
jgi:hypothetical protein